LRPRRPGDYRAPCRTQYIRLVIEAIEWDDRLATLTGHAALQVKGHEAGGRVGEETSFVLLQKALRRQSMPCATGAGAPRKQRRNVSEAASTCSRNGLS
jgi:hypothetical protein